MLPSSSGSSRPARLLDTEEEEVEEGEGEEGGRGGEGGGGEEEKEKEKEEESATLRNVRNWLCNKNQQNAHILH